MIPGVNKRQMQQMMRQMGMSQDEVEASEVIIKLSDRKLVFSAPQVSKVSMMGQDTFQIVGEPEEFPLDDEQMTISDDDIQTVMDQANVTREKAVEAIDAANGDLAEAIMNLQE